MIGLAVGPYTITAKLGGGEALGLAALAQGIRPEDGLP